MAGRHAVDLVDEEHLVGLEVGQHRRQVARLLDHRARPWRARARPSRRRSRRPAWSCRGPAVHTAARGPAPRGGRARPPPTPAGCRGYGPGRCTRSACAGAARPRTRVLVGTAAGSYLIHGGHRRSGHAGQGRIRALERALEHVLEGGCGGARRPWPPRRPSRPMADDSRGSGAPRARRPSADPRAGGRGASSAARQRPAPRRGPSAPARCARPSSCRCQARRSGARRRRAAPRPSRSRVSMPDRSDTASFGPMPLMPIRRSKSWRSRSVQKP